MYVLHSLLLLACLDSLLDIIACLIIGVILVTLFILWERHLENFSTSPGKPQSFWTPPPLMKVSIWARARGRMAAILVVAFLNWSGFMSWAFWAQVRRTSVRNDAQLLTCPCAAVLPELHQAYTLEHHGPLFAHVRHGLSL